MAEENISQELRLKNIDGTRNYLIEEITRNELMNKKHKKISKITKCVSISLLLLWLVFLLELRVLQLDYKFVQ